MLVPGSRSGGAPKFRPRAGAFRRAAVPPLLPRRSGRRPLSRPGDFRLFPAFPSRCSSRSVLSFFSPALPRRDPAASLLWPRRTALRLAPESAPQVRCCVCPFAPPGSTGCVAEDVWASRSPARSPPAPGLTAGSCSCGRRFAQRCFRLSPCVSLRLASSPPSSTSQLVRLSACWAHWSGLSATPASTPAAIRPRSASGHRRRLRVRPRLPRIG